MWLKLGAFFVSITSILAAQLQFFYTPKYIDLPSTAKLSTKDLGNLQNQLLGLTNYENNIEFPMKEDLWKRPEATVLFTIKTENDADFKFQNSKSFEILEDGAVDFLPTFSQLGSTYSSRDYTQISIDGGEIHGKFKGPISKIPPAENSVIFVEKNLITEEISALRAVKTWLEISKVRNEIPDVFWFEIGGFQELVQKYGPTSIEATTAKKFIIAAIEELSKSLEKVYEGNVVIEIATISATISRQRRAGDSTPKIPTVYNVVANKTNYKFFNQDYAVAFNMILWLGITLTIVLLSIGVWMWFMNPGFDSMVYRMTQTRMKRE